MEPSYTLKQRNQLSATPLPAPSVRPSRPPVPLFRPSPSATPAPESGADSAAHEDLESFRHRSQSLALDFDDDEDALPPLPSQLETRKRNISSIQEEPEE